VISTTRTCKAPWICLAVQVFLFIWTNLPLSDAAHASIVFSYSKACSIMSPFHYSPFQDDFSNYEANDPWVQTFIVNIDNFLVTFKVHCPSKVNKPSVPTSGLHCINDSASFITLLIVSVGRCLHVFYWCKNADKLCNVNDTSGYMNPQLYLPSPGTVHIICFLCIPVV